MTALVIVAIALPWLLAGLLAWQRAQSVDRIVSAHLRRDYVLETKAGETFRGLLVDADDRSVVLRHVESIDPTMTAPTPVDGELVIARADVLYLQRP